MKMASCPEEKFFLAARLRVLREQTGLTQEAFAERIGISYKVYQSIEARRRWNLRLTTILRFADSHGLTLTQLFSAKTPQSRLGKSSKP